MKRNAGVAAILALSISLLVAPNIQAQDEWKFGIGTGISSFNLDGDLGFPTGMGGVVFDVDLDNSETSDLLASGFGLGGFAKKGKWTILYSAGRVTLEDNNPTLEAEWDKDQVELAGVYNFANTGNHSWGVLFGARHFAHDWKFMTGMTTLSIDESWTDGIVGVTHAVPFAGKWAWTNRLDAGFGDSESSSMFKTAINYQAWDHWQFNFNVKVTSIEFGDMKDIADSDFYLYDIDETAVGVGVMYTF